MCATHMRAKIIASNILHTAVYSNIFIDDLTWLSYDENNQLTN